MCGISGLINYKGDVRAVISGMNDHMKDRGPDAEGIWISPDSKIALGHRRLAIRDLSANGAQPMRSHSGRFWMVYNGEIYNAAVLRERLIKESFCKDTDFRGTSDTEILLEGIEAYGVYETLSVCKGMFAIVVYDTVTGRLQLARDRVGEKPLYYGFVGRDSFAFASDIGCFTCIPEFEKNVNRAVLPLYFAHGYIPAPYSIYEDVYKLMPGTILTIDDPYAYFNPISDGDLAAYYKCGRSGFCFNSSDYLDASNYKDIEKNTGDLCSETGHAYTIYWSMKEVAGRGQNNLFTGSEQEAADELERLIKESIKGQMISDVPLGAFLSAGIDSSTIVSLMQQVAPGRVKTFTIGMHEEGFNEADIAGEIAGILGTEHTQMYIDDNDAKAVIPKLADMFGEPFADSSQIPTYLVSKMTRQHVTVSLSGDAGDELFCGYTSYRSIERIWNKTSRISAPIRKASGAVLSSIASGDNAVRAALLRASDSADLHMIEQDPYGYGRRIPIIDRSGSCNRHFKGTLYAGNTQGNYLSEVNHNIMLLDMNMYHPDDILVKVDRTAMAVSLETRVPFLDRDVVEFAWTLPIDYLRDDKVGKKVLRNVLYRYVPKELMGRPKKGFSIPIMKWLLEPQLRQWAENLVDPVKIKNQGFLNENEVTRLWKDFVTKKEWRPQIWYILMFQQWLENVGL
ncbi:asparagine synthetase B family protein [Butyrivibrio fibrisolvens]|nr:asparagine synthase-related protein [Butyrivibrio fibrisolvens]